MNIQIASQKQVMEHRHFHSLTFLYILYSVLEIIRGYHVMRVQSN